jgi:hypothetical protein
MSDIVYAVTYSKLMPGTPEGYISDLLEYAFTDISKAEKHFEDLVLTPEYFRKELWACNNNGSRRLIKEKHYEE